MNLRLRTWDLGLIKALGVGLLALLLAYQSNRPLFVNIGGAFDSPHTPGFYAPEESGQADFRWSSGYSSLLFQGVGKPTSPFPVRLQLSSGRGTGTAPVQVQVEVNGHSVSPLSLTPESAAYSVMVDPEWIGPSGDLQIDFVSPIFSHTGDKRELAFVADFARVELPSGLILPSITQLVWLLLCGLLFYLMLRSVWISVRGAAVLTVVFLVGCAAVIAGQRLLLTIFTERLAVTLIIALLMALFAEPVIRWVVKVAGWRDERALPEWAWVGLRGLIMLAAVLKIGGLLYPHTFIIDAPFHIRLVHYMAEGRPFEEYFGKNLALAVMPKEEWGAARAFIPYSPFFYVIAAPLAWLPFPLETSVPVFSGILETLKVPLVFLLGLALGDVRGAARRALLSAAVYSFIPATFLLQQWGNWPTLTSLWLVTAWAAITCLFWTRITHRAVWVISTIALALTLLSYTVTAAYTGVFIAMLVIGGWTFSKGDRKRWTALALSLVAAAAISLIVYYGRYAGDVISQTLPTFGQAVSEQGKLTTLRPTFGGFLTDNIGRAMQSYNLAIIYAIGLAGTLLVFLKSIKPTQPKSYFTFQLTNNSKLKTQNSKLIWLAAWLLTFPLFTLGDFYIDQALKEFWYALPAISVVSAVWLSTMMDKGKMVRVYSLMAGLLWATLAWQSISLWIFRLLFHNR